MLETKQWEMETGRGAAALEVGGEYTLPDYLPQIKRILRTDCQVLGGNQFQRGEETEVSGAVRYYVLYLDEEGNPASYTVDGDFVGVIPTGDGVEVMALPHIEGYSCRPLGPRRLSLKGTVKLGCLSTTRCEKENPLPEGDASLEVLKRSLKQGYTEFLNITDVALTDTLSCEAGSRVLSVEGSPMFREVKAEAGGIRVRGEVFVTLLMMGDMSGPYSLKTKMPFEEFLPGSTFAPGDMAVAYGTMKEVSPTVSEGEAGGTLTLDCLLDIWAVGATNQEWEWVEDLYSTKHPVAVTGEHINVRWYPGMQMANYTVDVGCDTAQMECHGAERILDSRGYVTVDSCSWQNGEMTVEGSLKVSLLTMGEKGYIPCSFGTPYKVRVPLREGISKDAKAEVYATCVQTACRMEGEQIRGESEVQFSIIFKKEDTYRVVGRVDVDTETTYETNEEIVRAVYLGDGDSLWSICKEYHVPMEDVIRGNSLPKEIGDSPNSTYLLDGLTRIVL